MYVQVHVIFVFTYVYSSLETNYLAGGIYIQCHVHVYIYIIIVSNNVNVHTILCCSFRFLLIRSGYHLVTSSIR